MSKPTRCTGLLGWIFGHRFTERRGDLVWDLGHCRRCGFRP